MRISEKNLSGICFYLYIAYIKRKITRNVFTSHKVFNQCNYIMPVNSDLEQHDFIMANIYQH